MSSASQGNAEINLRLDVLHRLLSIPGPSGFEADAARAWRAHASEFADEINTDVAGNSFAILRGGAPRVLLDGHIDEIGLMVTHIDDDGFLYVATIGHWDPQVLVGQRITVRGRQGPVAGVIGRKPIHLLKGEALNEAITIRNLWIDIGARDKADAQSIVRVGSSAVVDALPLTFPNGRIVARGLDNRAGAFTVVEVLRHLEADRPAATVAAVASVKEEIGGAGARAAAFSFEPQVAIVVDVTFATDDPGGGSQEWGEVKLGGGVVLSPGAATSPVLFEMLCEVAEREGIPYSVQSNASYTGTNADVIQYGRSGVACAVVSIPNRYMHSPSEMVQTDDIIAAVRLITALVRDFSSDTDFVPR